MRIEKLKITGLYGYINKEIDFNSDLTMLVGINGSGKTSILNILNWIIKPSIPDLCITEFKVIQLLFSYKGINYDVVCKHLKSSFRYQIKTEKETFASLIVRLKTKPGDIKNDESLKAELNQYYSALSPVQTEKKTWDLISTFPNPTIIGLDRNLYIDESERFYYDDSLRGKIIKKHPLTNTSPLNKVKEIVNTEYRKKKNSILNLTSNLKNHLMLSTFDGNITIESVNTGIKQKLDLNQIEEVENRVKEFFKNFEKKELTIIEQQTITNYFFLLKKITKEYLATPKDEKVKLLYGLNANQFVKVSKLLREFEKFEDKSTEALEQIKLYIDTLNYFLKDSAKELIFKEDTSELTFNTLDKNNKVITAFKDIKFLSSGEQQILILFTYIAFNSEDGKLFIIDEPELSLHIKWQEDFLDQLEKITPKSIQLILATHSPILANKKKNKTKVLFPYNF